MTPPPKSESAVAAIVLAGGAGRRLGGGSKPAVRVAGVPMIERVLAAVAPTGPVIVVGPPDVLAASQASLPPTVRTLLESPPGGGPVAAIGAAFRAGTAEVVVIVAADLPLLSAEAVQELSTTARRGRVDGAVYVDAAGRRQWLCGAWWSAAIIGRLDAVAQDRGDLAGASLRELFGPLAVAEVQHDDGPPPWFDCDTYDDIRIAEEWLGQ